MHRRPGPARQPVRQNRLSPAALPSRESVVRIVRPVVQTVSDVTGRVRDLNRLQEVAPSSPVTVSEMVVAGIDLPGTRDLGRTFASTPDRLKRAIEQLGPTFVKLGRCCPPAPTCCPRPTSSALQELQDDVDPLLGCRQDQARQ